MAEDYLTDDEQWEVVKRWIAENGLWIVGGVVVGAALLFGWRYYQGHENDVALKAAAQFGEMTAALERDDRNKSRQVADGLIKDFPGSPYADQAQLTLARMFIDDGQMPGAIAPLTQVMNNSKDAELRHIARLRLARVLIDQGKPDDAIKTLAEDTPGSFAARYHEVRGDAFYAKKDSKGAETEYKAALVGGDASSVDSALLELKIADLGAPATAAVVPAPPLSNKAKP
jgi:predicted negative regulator of RcsB-dependent stress response